MVHAYWFYVTKLSCRAHRVLSSGYCALLLMAELFIMVFLLDNCCYVNAWYMYIGFTRNTLLLGPPAYSRVVHDL
jgi:hypothetical protein